MLNHPSVPALLPAYSQVVIAENGNAWAQVYAPDLLASATWDVYSPDREWLGQVQTPARFRVHAIADGKLVGVWRDELGVEYVRIFRWIRAD